MFIAKRSSFAVREDGNCKLLRLKFHKASKKKGESHFKKILGFRLFLMTLPVGLAVLAMQAEFYAKAFSNIILADLHS